MRAEFENKSLRRNRDPQLGNADFGQIEVLLINAGVVAMVAWDGWSEFALAVTTQFDPCF